MYFTSVFKKSQLESGEAGVPCTRCPDVPCPKHTVSQWTPREESIVLTSQMGTRLLGFLFPSGQ